MAIVETKYATVVISATHSKLGVVRNAQITSNTINTIKVKFDFKTQDWDGLFNTAVFWRASDLAAQNNDAKVLVILDQNNECNIPSQMTMDDNDIFFVGVYGSGSDNDAQKRIVSNFIQFRVVDGCYGGGNIPSEDTPDMIEQLVNSLKYTAGENVEISNNVINVIIPDNLATKEYVDENGGKIDQIFVNGIEQEIVDKKVNIVIDPNESSGSYDDTEIKNEISNISSTLINKQDKIEDLDRIRNGAELGYELEENKPITFYNKEPVTIIENEIIVPMSNGYGDIAVTDFPVDDYFDILRGDTYCTVDIGGTSYTLPIIYTEYYGDFDYVKVPYALGFYRYEGVHMELYDNGTTGDLSVSNLVIQYPNEYGIVNDRYKKFFGYNNEINSFTEGYLNTAEGGNSHAEGENTFAGGNASHAEGYKTIASGGTSHAEGSMSKSMGDTSHAEGQMTKAIGHCSHTEGFETTSQSNYAHAEGYYTNASGMASHTEGYSSKASGQISHAEGQQSIASGQASHAEGFKTLSSGDTSHAEGYQTTASASVSHAEGYITIASGLRSHTEGYGSKATANQTHAEGTYTIASGQSQHAEGKFNIADTTSAHIVGNGTAETNRSNAHTLDFNGNAWYAGDVYVHSTSGKNKDDGSKKLLTEDDIGGKLTEPSNLAVGKYFKIASIDENGHAVLECVDAPVGGVTDTTVNGTSVVNADGVANIPNVAKDAYGIPKFNSNDFTIFDGTVEISTVTNAYIDDYRISVPSAQHRALPVGKVGYAVKAVFCDGKDPAWSAQEQAAAQERLGIYSVRGVMF